MGLDEPPNINPQVIYRPDSPDSLPELECLVSYCLERNALLKQKVEDASRDAEKLVDHMDLDDMSEHNGGVVLTSESDMISDWAQSHKIGSTEVATEVIDLTSPNSKDSFPTALIRSQRMTQQKGLSRDVDSDDDSMPDLEDIGGAPISPPSPPPPTIATSIKNTSPALTDAHRRDPSTKPTSFPISNQLSIAVNITSHSPTTTTPSTSTSTPPPQPIKISWFVRAPEDQDEKDLCERACEELARFHGFQKVVIKSRILTHHTIQSWFTTRHIFIEPHFLATFTSDSYSPYWGRREKIVQEAEIHVGPPESMQEEGDWTKWGVWRKGGREAVVWKDASQI